jgi:hypothetical protein
VQHFVPLIASGASFHSPALNQRLPEREAALKRFLK